MSTMFIYQLTDTWNDANTAFTSIGLDVTDTASAAGSLLIDLKVGGVSQFSVSKEGTINAKEIKFLERTNIDPDKPAEGRCVIWMTDGTGLIGSDGDVLIASTAGGITNYAVLFDHSAGTLWEFYPDRLFASGAEGVFYDISDMSTLYQDAAGTTPVTAVEQPVGRALDKSGGGNHATQSTSANRPTYSRRYNLLTHTEQFDNAAWTKVGTTITANAAVAPDGETTADKVTEVAAANTPRVAFGSAATIIGRSYTVSFYAKAAERDQVRLVLQGSGLLGPYFLLTGAGSVSDTGNTIASITSVGDGWYRCVATYTATATNPSLYMATASGGSIIGVGDDTKGIYLWGAQLLHAADQAATGGAYQRVAAATDYDTSNPVWRPYLRFDGSNDSLATGNIDFSGTDKITVFAGVMKLSDAALGVVAELSADISTNNGAFLLTAPDGASATFAFDSKGTSQADAVGSSAEHIGVLTGAGDISGDVATLRLNGSQVATSATDQGTGNFGNHALNIGARAGSSDYLNGRLYAFALVGKLTTTIELSASENWWAGKTGVELS